MAADNYTTEGYRYTVHRSRRRGGGAFGRIVVSLVFVLFLAGLVVGGVLVAGRMEKEKPKALPSVEVERFDLERVMPNTPVGSSRFLVKEDLAGDTLLGSFGPCDPGVLSGERAHADRYFNVPASIAIAAKTPEERVGVGLAVWSFRSGAGGELGWRTIRSAIKSCGGLEPSGAAKVPEADRSVMLDVDSGAANARGSRLRYVVARWDRWVVVGVSSVDAEAIGATSRGIQTVQELDQLLAKTTATTVAGS